MKLKRTEEDAQWDEPFGAQATTPHQALEVWATNALFALENAGPIEPRSPAHKNLRAILLGIQELS